MSGIGKGPPSFLRAEQSSGTQQWKTASPRSRQNTWKVAVRSSGKPAASEILKGMQKAPAAQMPVVRSGRFPVSQDIGAATASGPGRHEVGRAAQENEASIARTSDREGPATAGTSRRNAKAILAKFTARIGTGKGKAPSETELAKILTMPKAGFETERTALAAKDRQACGYAQAQIEVRTMQETAAQAGGTLADHLEQYGKGDTAGAAMIAPIVARDMAGMVKDFAASVSADPGKAKGDFAHPDTVNDALARFFGNPEDPASVRQAALKLPVSTRTEVAVRWRAIGDLGLSDKDRNLCRTKMLQDALMHHGLLPLLANAGEEVAFKNLSHHIGHLSQNTGLKKAPEDAIRQFQETWNGALLAFGQAVHDMTAPPAIQEAAERGANIFAAARPLDAA